MARQEITSTDTYNTDREKTNQMTEELYGRTEGLDGGIAGRFLRRTDTGREWAPLVVWREAWNALETYVAGDFVRHTGQAWLAVVSPAVGSEPTVTNPDWAMVVRDGDPGPPGEPGPSSNAAFGPVRVASTANIDLATGGTLTVDGIATAAGNRVLVKDQTDAALNGIYAVATGAWARAADADMNEEFVPGKTVSISEGTKNGNQLWAFDNTAVPTLGTTVLAFVQVGGGGGGVAPGAFYAYQSVDFSVSSSATVPLRVDTVAYDDSGGALRLYPDPNNSTSFVAPEAGDYQFEMGVEVTGLQDGQIIRAAIYRTPSPFLQFRVGSNDNTRGSYFYAQGSRQVRMAAGDVMAPRVYWGGGTSAITIKGSGSQWTYFAGRRVA